MGKNIVFSFFFFCCFQLCHNTAVKNGKEWERILSFFFFFFCCCFQFCHNTAVREDLENNSFLDSETCSKMLYDLTARVAY